ncbi:MAG: hypothetical protein AAGF95_15120 [Chloroflexota bacterium]
MTQPIAHKERDMFVKGIPHDVTSLKALLSSGWQIEPPVLARLAWGTRQDSPVAYHFIVTRHNQRSLIVIAESTELHSFLREQALPVS